MSVLHSITNGGGQLPYASEKAIAIKEEHDHSILDQATQQPWDPDADLSDDERARIVRMTFQRLES